MALFQGPQTTTQSVSTPDYLRPYYDRSINRAESAATEAYKPYTGQLVAGLSPLETQSMNSAAGLQLPGQFTSAGNIYNRAAEGLGSVANYQPTTFSSGYQAQQTTGGVFDSGAAQQYMNPFIQNVLDIQKREAERDFGKQQSQLRARAGAAGAFGGSRATLLETENQRNQNQLLSDIQERGLASAFTNAQDAFERDRQARLNAFQANEAARQAAGTLGLDAQRLTESSRQFGAQRAQEGLEGMLRAGQGLASLGQTIGQESRANIGTQAALGQQAREQQQAGLTAQYQQFLEERGYPMQQAKQFAEILGNLGSGQRVTSTTTPSASNLNQLLGALATGTGILGEIGGVGGAQAGLSSLIGGLGSLFGGQSSTSGASGPSGAQGSFDLGGFFGNIGTGVSDAFTDFTGFLDGLLPETQYEL